MSGTEKDACHIEQPNFALPGMYACEPRGAESADNFGNTASDLQKEGWWMKMG